MKFEKIRKEDVSPEHVEFQVRQGALELQKGHQKEGEAILWKALTEASSQKNVDVAAKILELLSSTGTTH